MRTRLPPMWSTWTETMKLIDPTPSFNIYQLTFKALPTSTRTLISFPSSQVYLALATWTLQTRRFQNTSSLPAIHSRRFPQVSCRSSPMLNPEVTTLFTELPFKMDQTVRREKVQLSFQTLFVQASMVIMEHSRPVAHRRVLCPALHTPLLTTTPTFWVRTPSSHQLVSIVAESFSQELNSKLRAME